MYHSAHSVSTRLITSFGPTENSVFVFVCPSSTARFGSVVHVCIIYALWLVSQWRGVSWKKVRMGTLSSSLVFSSQIEALPYV